MNGVTGQLRSAWRRTKRFINEASGRDVRVALQHRCRREFLGTDYGGWCICPDQLDQNSIVYSFGVGEDISFDLAMIQRFGSTVHAFDPTPKSIEWIKKQSLPPQFKFHELGLAGYDGTARFVLPNPEYVSFSIAAANEHHQSSRTLEIEARVNRLSTIMKSLNHERIDVLKMDIEGAEYQVLDDLVNGPVPIGQLLVEFHHEIGNRAEVARTRDAISKLNAAGFRLFFRSSSGREFSFISPTNAGTAAL